ncbi:hypothetical protein ACIQXF_17645 [Lysinibacillus sp. NPDC097231]|uniref:hypothetical protein n=1 Tax=Lysinibacillus sp. NPDC097231 TaxID=3364142 RepID=UPI0038171C03
MKKLLYAGLTAAMVLSTGTPATLAKENIPTDGTVELKTVEVPLVNVLEDFSTYAINQSTTSTLTKDFATSTGQTGKIKSVGQYIDLSKVIPKDSKVVSVTIYCPTDVSVTQSKYTSIDNYLVKNGAGSTATVKFQKTNTPTSTSKTTAFAGEEASSLWFIQIEGTILMQDTGMDGFTVFGSRMIVEYK